MASQKMACVFIAMTALTLVSAQAQAPVQAPSPNFFSAPPVVAPAVAPAAAVPSIAPTVSTPVATPSMTPSVAPSTVPSASTPVEAPVVAPAVATLAIASAPAPGPATAENAGAMVSISGWRTLVLASGLLAAAAF